MSEEIFRQSDLVVRQPDLVVRQPDLVVRQPDLVVRQSDLAVRLSDLVGYDRLKRRFLGIRLSDRVESFSTSSDSRKVWVQSF